MKYEHQDLAFISDLHLFHSKVIIYDNRPFKDIDEMHDTIIQNWNSKISESTVVYYIGDLSYANRHKTKEILDKLNGKIHLILGNHDRYKDLSKIDRFESISGYAEIYVNKDITDNTGKDYQNIVMSHYPMMVWNKHHHGTIMLHGHCHQSLYNREIEFKSRLESIYAKLDSDTKAELEEILNPKILYNRKIVDVGCNGHNYTPLMYSDIIKIVESRNIIKLDHHEEE